MTPGNGQLSDWVEKELQSMSQSKTCTKKLMVTVWWSAGSLIPYSSLNPFKTITSENYSHHINDLY